MRYRIVRLAGTLALAWLPAPGWTQAFQDLSTTQDGSVLYFSSPTRQKGTDQTFHSKIFRWDAAGGIRVMAEVRDPGGLDGCTTANFFQLTAPQVSADGTVFAYTASRPAAGGRFCAILEPNQGVVGRLGSELRLDGNIAIGPSGRYAITTPLAAVANGFHVVTDLNSGMSISIAGAFNGSGQRVSDDGTILTPDSSAITLTDRNGGTRVLQTQAEVDDAILGRSGTTVVYLTRLGPYNPGKISAIDVATGREALLVTAFSPGNLSLTSDGSTVFYTDAENQGGQQLYSIGIGGGTPRQITTIAGGIGSSVVSGDGRIAFLAGDSLSRVDLASGIVTQLAPSTPFVTAAYRVYPPATTIAAVGSIMDLTGTGFAGFQELLFCGQPVSATPLPQFSALQFQVPLNTPEGPCDAIMQTNSPLEHGIALTVERYDPQFVQLTATQSLVVHQGFAGFITAASPAHVGETIAAYMTGLGPVDANGQLTAGFMCNFDSATPANVLYAGLAPGFPGIYQVNVLVPNLSESYANLNCGWVTLGKQAIAIIWLGPG